MKLSTEHRKRPDWPKLILKYRESLGMSRVEFGKVYGVSRTTVLYWETARNEAPYQVTWDVLRALEQGTTKEKGTK